MTSIRHSAIYAGRVLHHRFHPKTHRLVYRVFSLLIDLDELAALDRDLPMFSWNRWNVLSFHNRDHGDRDAGDLKTYAHRICREAGTTAELGRVELLCYPRLWGYVFNPLSVYYCYDTAGRVAAIIYEVRNTFGESHSYVLPNSREDGVLRHECAKKFYVSPFMSMDADYRFRVHPPGPRMNLAIRQSSGGRTMLNAAFVGERRALTSSNLARVVAQNPLMTLKVIGGIHWEALKMWGKGFSYYRRGSPPRQPFTVVEPILQHLEK